MKKIVLMPLLLLLLAHTADAVVYPLKLRASYHPEFLRIVMEGSELVISRAIVNEKNKNIMVTFPDTSFKIEEEMVMVAYKKIAENSVTFFPLEFREFKVFTLNYPSRLVIDVYRERGKGQERERREPIEVDTLVIDSGHGGYENGIVKDSLIEKHIVLDIAKKIKARISRGSKKCLLTRGSDRFLRMEERIVFANDNDADVFLSLHIGNHEDIVVYYPLITDTVPEGIRPFMVNKGQEGFLTETVALVRAMKKAIEADFGYDMVSIKPLPYSMLSKIEAAAIMVEFPSFEDFNYTEELRSELVETIYKGLYIYEENATR
jgi:hypothetical protein